MKQSIMTVAGILIMALFSSVLVFAGGSSEADVSEPEDDVIVVNFWDWNNMYGYIDTEHPYSKFFAERFGIAFEGPLVPWNGGVDYLQQLRVRIAADEVPDVFYPYQGIEQELAENDVIRSLEGLVQKHMPVYYKNVPEKLWSFVRAQSPSGTEIYFLPEYNSSPYGGHIRGDWLDRVGMEVPTTIEEYVDVLRAFRDQDANGNGDPNDEIPTSAREFARWMDHHFAPFGIAMVEGYPAWDIYDGKIQYSAVQPNMKEALAWIRDLYAEGLLDPESFTNTYQIWMAKIADDKVGAWFHGTHTSADRFNPIYDGGNKNVRFEYLPALKAQGYEPFYTSYAYRYPVVVISSDLSEEGTIRMLKVYEFLNDPANTGFFLLDGIEGYNYTVNNGKKVYLPESDWIRQSGGYRPGLGRSLYGNSDVHITRLEFLRDLAIENGIERDRLANENAIRLVRGWANDNVRDHAGMFVPTNIYDGYPDLKAHKLYQEYASRIIVGEWDIDRFDEFVELWYERGGDVITKRAQEAYAILK